MAAWAAKLPYWERLALDLVMSGEEIGDREVDLVLRLFLEDQGLAEPTERPPLALTPEMLPARENSAGSRNRLSKLFNLSNVNALAEGQSLEFGDELTIVFGGNGSGKSGYVRILAHGCFARGEREVFPNAFRPDSIDKPPSADLTYTRNGEPKTIHIQSGEPAPRLENFFIFDTPSAKVHLTDRNPFAYVPASLVHLSLMADLTDRVRARLDSLADESRNLPTFVSSVTGESRVADALLTLGEGSSEASIVELATFGEADESELSRLTLELAEISAKALPEKRARLRQARTDLEALLFALRSASLGLGSELTKRIEERVEAVWKTRIQATKTSQAAFRTVLVNGVGSEEWGHFIRAASDYGRIQHQGAIAYPQEGDHCLLCQQRLDEAALKLVSELLEFSAGEARTRMADAEEELAVLGRGIGSFALDVLTPSSVAFRLLSDRLQPVLSTLLHFLEAAEARRSDALEAIRELRELRISEPSLPDLTQIVELIKSIEAELMRLDTLDDSLLVVQIAARQRELSHRKLLRENLEETLKHIRRAKAIARAQAAVSDTKHITNFQNKLFKELVTDAYVQTLGGLLKRMDLPLYVKAEPHGQKGETVRRIILETDPTHAPRRFRPVHILSEGEQRAVAFADFMAEVTVSAECDAIVLDDPATSFDEERSEVMADLLAAEAKQRQVVVFTHDMTFAYKLKEKADQHGVEISAHWISTRPSDDVPGIVHLNNSPVHEEQFKTSNPARKKLAAAKSVDASAEEQAALISEAFDALRASYEALVIFDLFGGVVKRFGRRISIERLETACVDQKICSRIKDASGRVSGHIGAHLQSAAIAGNPLAFKTLELEIEAFDKLKGDLGVAKKKLEHEARSVEV